MAYKGVLGDVRTCLRGGIPGKMPVFGMSQVFDAVSAGYTYEEVLNDGSKLIDSVIRGIEDYDWDWGWAPLDDSITFEPLGIALTEDTLLINWVQNFLKMLNGTGVLKQMTDRWFKTASWIAELQ